MSVASLSHIRETHTQNAIKHLEQRVRALESTVALAISNGNIVINSADVGLKVYIQETTPPLATSGFELWIKTGGAREIIYWNVELSTGGRGWSRLATGA